MKIAFYDTKPYDKNSFNGLNEKYGFEITYLKPRLNAQTAPLAEGHDVVCAFVNDQLDGEVADILHKKGVRLVALRSAGYNNVELSSFFGRIHVVRVPAYSPYAVAEHAVALMMGLNRKTHRAYYRIRDNNFAINGFLGFDMHGKTAGVIGTGKIGRILVKILRGFGMEVVAFDHYPDEEFAKEAGMEYVNLDELYRRSDIISLHCPLTPETSHMINAESIAKMKDTVMIINTGRGQLIKTPDLINALKANQIGSAGLDVYEEEGDYFFEDFSSEIIEDDVLARLMTFNNVLITSHQAFFTAEALENIAETTLNNIQDFSKGKALINEICYQCEKDCQKKITGRCW